MTNKTQIDLLIEILNFKNQIKSHNPGKKKRKKIFLKTYMHYLMVEKVFLMIRKSNVSNKN